MKDSTKDQVQGKLHEAKGKVKEKAGILTKNPNLQAEGQDEKLGGKIQKKIGTDREGIREVTFTYPLTCLLHGVAVTQSACRLPLPSSARRSPTPTPALVGDWFDRPSLSGRW